MEDWLEVMKARHSVRRFLYRVIEPEKVEQLRALTEEINREEDIRFELVLDEPEVFQANRAHYGNFANCRNYFALFGAKKSDERVGYFGEKLVLLAQKLGLNTCWAAMTFERLKLPVAAPKGMRIHDVIALGYGENQGTPHRSKPAERLAKAYSEAPAWFRRGVEAALLAPTAINQQRFRFEWDGGRGVKAKALPGPCSRTDLGIVKLHFELGAGTENFEWA